MALNEYSIPAHVLQALKSDGYTPDTSMDTYITKWWNWYTSSDDWYNASYVNLENKKREYKRPSIHPARRVCREWANHLFTDKTEIAVEYPKAKAFLDAFLKRSLFLSTAQGATEKGFALGTGAWALWFDLKTSEIKIRSYDARMIIPLSWDVDGITECAFPTLAVVKGKSIDQLQEHVIVDGAYHIITRLFDKGKEIHLDGVEEDFNTQSDEPSFSVYGPALENVMVDMSPFGMSVFEDAIGAIKGVELSWEGMLDEIDLTKARLFVPESMIEMETVDGKKVPIANTDHRLYRLVNDDSENSKPFLFAPPMRVDELFKGINTALQQLGDLTGFGSQYFELDKGGGIKTATEVSSDNSQLMRNIKKHENLLERAVTQILRSLLTGYRIHFGADIEEDFGNLSVIWDDSIITDTTADKALMQSEIAIGVAQPWEYRVRFYGEDEETAKANAGGVPADEPDMALD